MTASPTRPPLVIVGPTASGKSALALTLANQSSKVSGPVEIVSADAMAVYRGMDVGTAKPTEAERGDIPHHLIDVVSPAEGYTVSRFAVDVRSVLEDLEQRSVTPVLVGGTGLYVRAVIDDFSMPGQYPDVVAELEAETNTAVLHWRLAELDPVGAAKMEPTNRRRVVRALEVCIGSGRPFSSFGPGVDHYPPSRFVQAGLSIDRDLMDQRIDARYDQQMADGLLEEVRSLRQAASEGRNLSRTARQALGYKELLDHLAGLGSLDEALDLAKKRTKRFARRQQRWFRRDPRIVWFEATDPDLVEQVGNWWGEQS